MTIKVPEKPAPVTDCGVLVTVMTWFVKAVASEWRKLTLAMTTLTVKVPLMLTNFSAVVAVVWVNSGWVDSYYHLGSMKLGPSWLSLDVEHWTADGLLAVFFFIAGLELKRELVVGSLRDPARAVLPVGHPGHSLKRLPRIKVAPKRDGGVAASKLDFGHHAAWQSA